MLSPQEVALLLHCAPSLKHKATVGFSPAQANTSDDSAMTPETGGMHTAIPRRAENHRVSNELRWA